MLKHPLELYLSERVVHIGSSGIRKAFELANKSKRDDIISLGLGEPDMDTPNFIKQAAHDALDSGFNRYTTNAGIIELRRAIADKYQTEQGIRYDPETEVIVTVGGINAIHLAILSLINPGDEVLLPDPFFVAFEPCVIMAGGRAVHVPLREEHGFRLQVADLAAAMTPRSKMVVVNTPHNPTGAVLSREDLEQIAQFAQANDLFVLADEVYEKLVYGVPHVSMAGLPGMLERTITINSFSKAYCMCGMRIGYAAAHHSIIEQMNKLQQFNSVHAPSYSQKAAYTALTGNQDFLRAMVAEFDRRREYVLGRLASIEGLHCATPQGTFYCFINIADLGHSSEDIFRMLLDHGHLVVVPGSALGTYGEGYIRLSYTVPMERLTVAMDRLEETVALIRSGKVH